MKPIKVEYIAEHTLILEAGIDYSKKDLVPELLTPSLSSLPSEILTRIATGNRFDKWTWAGHEIAQPELKGAHGIKVKFAKIRRRGDC